MRLQTKFGFDLTLRDGSYMASEFVANACYEEPESQFVLSVVRPGDFCIDAGAHVGYYSCLMAKAGAKSVLAFEPNPMHFAMLEENIDGLPVVVSHTAVGDLSAPATFYRPSEWDDGCGTIFPVRSSDAAISVQMMRLEDVLKEFPGKVRLLKLDVEGSELAALRGLGARLADVDYILMECGEYYAAKTISAINGHMEGWTIQSFIDGQRKTVPKATTGNFLFVNPTVTE